MSKRVSASAPALPIDGPDLDHVAKPLNFLDGSDVSHGLNGHNGDAGTKSVLAQSADQAPHAGALPRSTTERGEAPCRTASGQTKGKSHGKAEARTKTASPVLAKAHAPRALKCSQRSSAKPASILPDLPEIYAMHTDGDCMVPEILDGQKIIVSKTEEVKRGDTVCLWLKTPSCPEGYSALVKKVAMLPPPHVTFPYAEHPESEVVALVFVEQINPPRAYRFRCDQVLAMHKVIDLEGRG